jgi:hypothetical protein
VRHNVVGVGGDITYEVFVNGAATGVTVVLAASGTVATAPLLSTVIPANADVELRASHLGITTSPQRIVVTAAYGTGIFGDQYQRVDSPAPFTTGAMMFAPTPFVVKPGAVLVTPVLTGTYRIAWEVLNNTNSPNVDGGVRLFNLTDGVAVGMEQVFEPTSSSGEMEDMGASELIAFAGVSRTFQIEVRKVAGPPPGSTTVSQAVIELWRTGP